MDAVSYGCAEALDDARDRIAVLSAVLAELVAAHDAPPWDGDDPNYEKALAAGRRMDAAWQRAREALKGMAG